MDRSAFLKTGASFAASSLPWRDSFAAAGWHTFEVTIRAEVSWPEGASRVWLPLPLAQDTDWQHNFGSQWTGNAARAQILRDGKYGAAMLYAEWPAGERAPLVEVTSRFATRDRDVDPLRPDPGAERLSAAERALYTDDTALFANDSILPQTALKLF